MGRTPSDNPRRAVLSLRLTEQERNDVERMAEDLGYRSASDYLRHLHTQKMRERESETHVTRPRGQLLEMLSTSWGTAYLGNALDFLEDPTNIGTVDLVMTSPPFGLVRKKSYGNEDAHEYCDWFRPFAAGLQKVLKDDGSLVIDIGGAWKRGTPTRSLYHFELLVMLCNDYGFHLCQEYYWWNPAKLPTPAEWVNVRRIRVKDSVNCIWWLSKTPWPKASNRRVLAPYSESMKKLLKNGYRAKLRPSGHDISDNFSRDNGGSVPPNLLAIANTESNTRYQDYCRKRGLPVHPARFPALLPEYFIRMLTDRNELVFDPFAGSCMTGAVAESLARRWVCTELSDEYLEGARVRFDGNVRAGVMTKASGYTIHTPCANVRDEAEVPLPADGGRDRPTTVSRDGLSLTKPGHGA